LFYGVLAAEFGEPVARMTRSYPPRKIIGAAMMIFGVGGVIFFFPLLWLLLIYPFLAILLVVAAVNMLCTRSASPRVLRSFGFMARIFLVAATITAAIFMIAFAFEPISSNSHRLSDRLAVISLLVPQLLWFSRLGSSPLVALFVAIASLGPSAEMWIGGFQPS
jgi:hypothetical protein